MAEMQAIPGSNKPPSMDGPTPTATIAAGASIVAPTTSTGPTDAGHMAARSPEERSTGSSRTPSVVDGEPADAGGSSGESLKRKRSSYAQYQPEQLSKAVHAVRAGLSIREASRKFGVSHSTIHDRVAGKVSNPRPGAPTVLHEEEEEAIRAWVVARSARGEAVSKSDIMKMAAAIAADGRTPKFCEGLPSEQWWRSFRVRQSSEHSRVPDDRRQRLMTLMPEIADAIHAGLQPTQSTQNWSFCVNRNARKVKSTSTSIRTVSGAAVGGSGVPSAPSGAGGAVSSHIRTTTAKPAPQDHPALVSMSGGSVPSSQAADRAASAAHAAHAAASAAAGGHAMQNAMNMRGFPMWPFPTWQGFQGMSMPMLSMQSPGVMTVPMASAPTNGRAPVSRPEISMFRTTSSSAGMDTMTPDWRSVSMSTGGAPQSMFLRIPSQPMDVLRTSGAPLTVPTGSYPLSMTAGITMLPDASMMSADVPAQSPQVTD